MTDYEQADALGRASEGGAFDEAGLSYNLGRAVARGAGESIVEDEDAILREVERFLGERLKADVFWKLFQRFEAFKRFSIGDARSDEGRSWWALLAAERAQIRRRENELRRRASRRELRRRIGL